MAFSHNTHTSTQVEIPVCIVFNNGRVMLSSTRKYIPDKLFGLVHVLLFGTAIDNYAHFLANAATGPPPRDYARRHSYYYYYCRQLCTFANKIKSLSFRIHRNKSKNFLPKPGLFQFHNYNKNTTRIWKVRLQSDTVRNHLLFNN